MAVPEFVVDFMLFLASCWSVAGADEAVLRWRPSEEEDDDDEASDDDWLNRSSLYDSYLWFVFDFGF